MAIDFDPAKESLNLEKHGLSLARAEEIDLRAARILADGRKPYGERRFRAYGMLDGKLHMVVFTPRHGRLRIISLRRANAREVKRYG